ncbi:dolichol-p-glucose synthetase [Azorhizobium caulinodans ORS 571]|uniref:Dolichol-p-glucose synthetase n=1 Tax=Azorhizobium caulinodans (strain ATCC 43989 / DSM 5975 / JCM 20966 / LMG 6465 / NBRC 14845 / NCIMB 13405 / ORS 571) TaxID=438753 RepID=A8I878_AZOC5|nr:glycosyltransferase family 2 protein [Azorhizobium caulinodans]BAF88218.1 dolichol-p-glucose synthetase [Azorhizobium caulinodans ORS 571]
MTHLEPLPAEASGPLELTILMPCLNEAETLGVCVDKAMAYLKRSGISGEVLIADNGSTDGSQAIATAGGARVVAVPERGYGAALKGGIAAARGRYIIMGDADDSYDFSRLDAFVERLRAGTDIVMGNRFQGGIGPGAMPFLHRYLGNPVLSFLGRLFFGIEVGDFHCGLRGFNTEAVRKLRLETSGMEFASEMVVRASLAGLSIVEVPTTLKKDGRSRPPHLKTWRDGWRHLRFLLVYSPRWLFFYPGLVLILLGGTGVAALYPGPLSITPHLRLDIHTFLVAAMTVLIGVQAISFGVVARRYGALLGFLPASEDLERVLHAFSLERVLRAALVLGVLGLGFQVWAVSNWAQASFGDLVFGATMRKLILGLTALVAAVQLALTAFLASVVEMPLKR